MASVNWKKWAIAKLDRKYLVYRVKIDIWVTYFVQRILLNWSVVEHKMNGIFHMALSGLPS